MWETVEFARELFFVHKEGLLAAAARVFVRKDLSLVSFSAQPDQHPHRFSRSPFEEIIRRRQGREAAYELPGRQPVLPIGICLPKYLGLIAAEHQGGGAIHILRFIQQLRLAGRRGSF